MTTADFVAACFWPIAIAFTFLLRKVREPDLRRWLGRCALGVGLLYLALWFFFRRESLVAIVDQFILMAVVGVALIWFGAKSKLLSSDSRPRLKRYGFVAAGVVLILFSGTILFLDFARPRLVLEGRVQNVRTQGAKGAEYVAGIAGRTVKATTPVYERLKLLPYVRVEVGRGSDYIFKIEYVAN
ncbi:hypothetical protein [Afipia birgiae]|jgi:hypothetical protein|uniref:hypothetical protein n=1 Tax=Afipia birgiae TaxID=151414 RepID=UPI0002E08241|nr:hypothetical protein [Afipia birgiae]MBX9820222.1 hypothetical protein [Afipia birgiae]